MKVFVYFHTKRLLTSPLIYKYMVYSTAVTNKRGQAHEFLNEYSSNVKRYLEVPKKSESKSLPQLNHQKQCIVLLFF